jgi:hypothetical protein
MSDAWQTASALATGAGTLVLAVATFSAVRSSNRSARVAEQALLTGLRPLLVPSLADDPAQKLLWVDRHHARLEGGRAIFETADDVVYLAMAVRNVGSGIALLHGWDPVATWVDRNEPRREPDAFRRQSLDLYVAAGGAGYWEAAIREPDDPEREAFLRALKEREPVRIDLLYGDQMGGQRTVSRFSILPLPDDGWYCQVSRHWHLDRPDPR